MGWIPSGFFCRKCSTGVAAQAEDAGPTGWFHLRVKVGNQVFRSRSKVISPEVLEIYPAVHHGNNKGVGTNEKQPDIKATKLVPHAQVGAGSQEDLHTTILTSSNDFTTPGYVPSSGYVPSKRGKKRDNVFLTGKCCSEDKSPVAGSITNAKRQCRQKIGDGRGALTALTPSKDCSKRGKKRDNLFLTGNCCCEGKSPVATSIVNAERRCRQKIADGRETLTASPGLGIFRVEVVPSKKSKAYPPSESSKSYGTRKRRSKVSDSARSKSKTVCTQLPGNQMNSVSKTKANVKGYRITKDVSDQVEDKAGHLQMDIGPEHLKSGVSEQQLPPAWVCCDDCNKWRRVPAVVANSIDENCRWVCKDNMEIPFAHCSIPKEKTNADIYAELGISECEALPGPHFELINSNVFLHRSRNTQTIDEIMVCSCKPPRDGLLGCGDKCLNRMLNIECVQDTCPCGVLCSNQEFQKRKYAKMKLRRCGKKGFGLASLEDISEGHFIIEYVGEVLDMQAYEARQKEYTTNGHRHFYFMTVGTEVIDACAKGNLSRFINHSCDPNCSAEKWTANGETCIGFFALRDIKEGEELTFDYKYKTVPGAAAIKCHCGSPQCRGYMGVRGDPPDEEYSVPEMIEDGAHSYYNSEDVPPGFPFPVYPPLANKVRVDSSD